MSAIIFRKRLLAYTETFIANQGQYLPNIPAIFAGFKTDSTGFDLIEQKAQAGHEYHISLEERLSPLPALTSGLHKRFNILNERWINELAYQSPKVLHAHFGPDGLAARSIAKKLNIPLITTFHGFDITIDSPTNNYRKNRHKIFEESQYVIAVSDFVKQQLLKKGCPKEKIILHYIGVDTAQFTPATHKKEGTLVFVGRLVDKKGCEYLIRAMNYVEKSCPGATLRIIGDGPLKEDLKELALSSNANIIFTGRLTTNEVKREVQKASILCAPSITTENGDQEGLPISIMEALACGTPVISSYSAGIAEAIQDGFNGFLLQEKDVFGLAEKITGLLNNNALQQEMKNNARNTALSKFDLSSQCANLEQIYDKAR